MDSNPATNIFIASPETVIAQTFAGNLDFDPSRDSIETERGSFRFAPPEAPELPSRGFADADYMYTAPPADRSNVTVHISPESKRLQRLEPFKPWNGEDYVDLPILIKVEGKCTTDHITPAGPWHGYRGHLENVSHNTLIGATNAANKKVNCVKNVFTGTFAGVPETAFDYKKRNQQWVIIGDQNYGEGSSREHAALQPRFLNGVAVIAKSFARIHEANLKKQGMLPLTFSDPSTYGRIDSDDRISLLNLNELRLSKRVRMLVRKADGSSWGAELDHSFNDEQISYFRAGSALNLLAQMARKTPGMGSSQ